MKKSILLLFGISIFCAFACKQTVRTEAKTKISEKGGEAAFAIEILDQEALKVIDPNEKLKVEASGFTWTEGPLWIEDGAFLLFSDIPNNKVYKLEANGDTSTFLQPSGGDIKASSLEGEPGSNGLLLSPEGELVLMQHGDRRVAKMNAPLSNPKENYVSLIDNYQGQRLNSPNDGTYDKQGNLYFTDPPYGLPGLMDDPNKELDFQGVYFLKSSGELIVLDTLTKPNGIALSPDGTSLYVAVSDPTHAVWYKYSVESPGVVKDKKIFYDVTHLANKKGQQGMPDGLKVNQQGYIFATGAAGVWIFNEDGKPLARIYTGQRTSNCALAYNEKKLFMTADDYILSVKLK